MDRGIWIGILLLSLIFVVPQIIVPLTQPVNTIHTPVAVSMSDPATWPYAYGALMCHQRPERSFFLAGNQLPICVRCFGIELGMIVGFCVAVVVNPPNGFFPSLGAFLPRRFRSRYSILATGLLLMLPMAIDGGLQLVTTYVSATPQRLITGFLYGIGVAGIVIGSVAALIFVATITHLPE